MAYVFSWLWFTSQWYHKNSWRFEKEGGRIIRYFFHCIRNIEYVFGYIGFGLSETGHSTASCHDDYSSRYKRNTNNTSRIEGQTQSAFTKTCGRKRTSRRG